MTKDVRVDQGWRKAFEKLRGREVTFKNGRFYQFCRFDGKAVGAEKDLNAGYWKIITI